MTRPAGCELPGGGYAIPGWLLVQLHTDRELALSDYRRRLRGRDPQAYDELVRMCVAAHHLAAASGRTGARAAEAASSSASDVCTTAQAAAVLGVSERRVRQLIATGELPSERTGYAYRLQRGQVRDLAARRRVA